MSDSVFGGGNGSSLTLRILRGSGIGLIFAALLSFVFTAVALSMEDPNRFISPLSYGALFVGALAAGISAPRDGISRPIASAISGGVYSVAIWLASIPFRQNGDGAMPFWISALLYLGCILVSVIGGSIFSGGRQKISRGKKSPAAMMRKSLGTRS